MGSDVEVTAADREKAAHLVANWSLHFGPDDLDPLRAMVETYLADERAKARAPFLALIKELRREGLDSGEDPYRAGLDVAADFIEEVAERADEDPSEVRET